MSELEAACFSLSVSIRETTTDKIVFIYDSFCSLQKSVQSAKLSFR